MQIQSQSVLNKRFILRKRDSPRKTWGKKLLVRFISMWVTGGSVYWLHGIFLRRQCETGRYVEAGEAAEQNRKDVTESGNVWKKRRRPCCSEILKPHWFFFSFFLFNDCLHNLHSLQLSSCCCCSPERAQWNYTVTPYAERAIIFQRQQSDHSAFLTSRLSDPGGLFFFFRAIFLEFVANCFEGLNQLNLSPVIMGDYKHLDILLFRIKEMGGQLSSNYMAGSPD